MSSPPANLCLARLTSWETTNSPIGSSNKRASIVKICKNTPREGLLCDDCASRPTEGKYQTRMCHGLLTDPPCDASHLYGSLWYWDQVGRYGEPFDRGWLLGAHRAQCIAEAHCKRAGYEPWRVQRPSEKEVEEMKERKKAGRAAGLSSGAAPSPASSQPTLLKHIPMIETFYEESAKDPEKMPTDTMKIVKKGDVWVTENGFVFKCGSTGEPTKLLSRPGAAVAAGQEES
jgi:hypothetical protein